MKIRQGFVSNSSSSSFICPACKDVFEIMDGSPDESLEFFVCENNHPFCHKHEEMIGEEILFEQFINALKDEEENLSIKAQLYISTLTIKKFKKDLKINYLNLTNLIEKEHILMDLFQKDNIWAIIYGIKNRINAECCPICKKEGKVFPNTFEEIPDFVLGEYLLKYNGGRDTTINEIQNRFKTVEEFKKYINFNEKENRDEN